MVLIKTWCRLAFAFLGFPRPHPSLFVTVERVPCDRKSGSDVLQDHHWRGWSRGCLEFGLDACGVGPAVSLDGGDAFGGNGSVRVDLGVMVNDAREWGGFALGDVGNRVRDGISDAVPGVGVVLHEVLQGVLVGFVRVFRPCRGNSIFATSAVQFKEFGCFGVVFVKGVGTNVEHDEASREALDKLSPFSPKVRVGAYGGRGEARGVGSVEVKAFGVGDDEEVAGVEEEFKSTGGSMEFGAWDGQFSGA